MMEKPGVVEGDQAENSPGIQSFIQKQRQIMGGHIEDQLGPSALLDQVISGNPLPPQKEIQDPERKALEE